MTTPMAPQPDPDINGLGAGDVGEGALAEAALDDAAGGTAREGGSAEGGGSEVAAQAEQLNLTPEAPGPSGTGETE